MAEGGFRVGGRVVGMDGECEYWMTFCAGVYGHACLEDDRGIRATWEDCGHWIEVDELERKSQKLWKLFLEWASLRRLLRLVPPSRATVLGFFNPKYMYAAC